LFGIIFPFCHSHRVGYLHDLIYGNLSRNFPRVWIKRQQFLQTPRGTSLMEHYDRIAFAYYLVLTCSIVWTVLVVFTRSSGFSLATYLLTTSIIRSDTLGHDFGQY
jgi:hypothetical protein